MLSASAPGGTVTLSLDASSSGCSLSGHIVTFTSLGTCVIDASVAATTSYEAATASQSVAVTTPATTVLAPTNVTAIAGDTQVLVAWSASLNAGAFSAVSHTVSSTPGGVGCVSTSTSCLMTGLADGTDYVFTVVANSTGIATASSASIPTSAVTPSTTAISVGTSGGTAELNPGTGAVTQSDGTTTVATVTTQGQSVTVTNGSVSLTITASSVTGTVTGSTVVISSGGTAVFSGSGFLPGSTVDIYLFSSGTFIGTAIVRQDGTYSASLSIPSSISIGNHTVQSQGFSAAGTKLAVRIGVVVKKAVKISLVISKFASNTTALTTPMKASIGKLAQTIKVKGASSALITGYSDNQGTTASNLVLARARSCSRNRRRQISARAAETSSLHQGGASQHRHSRCRLASRLERDRRRSSREPSRRPCGDIELGRATWRDGFQPCTHAS